MHLLETYALSTGSKIKKPFIFKKFYPLPFDKYITIQNSSGMQGKCYDYFQDLIDFIYEDLNKLGYQIIQIGSKDDKPLKNTFQLQGQTSINQTAFILENSKLHIGNDSFAIHMCSAFNTPLIALYSVSSPEIAGPFWKNNNQICLTPKNWKPSFNPNDNPKRINEIKIESIVESINNLLNINITNFSKTTYIGSKYNHFILESLPSQILHPQSFEKQLLNVRFDYLNNDPDEKDYSGLVQNLNIRQCCIITDKPLIVENFAQFKQNLPMIIYDVTKNINIEFIQKMTFFGLNFSFIFKTEESSLEELNKRKEQIIEFPHIIEEIKCPMLGNLSLNEDNLFYKTNKIFIANNNAYLGKYGYLNNVPLENNLLKPQKIVNQNIEEFIKNDLEYSFIFKNV
jgi:Glycosyltransferase family 9 (heptosyltransferase)